MNRLIPSVVASGIIALWASAATAQEDAKLRAQIDALERELVRVSRELQELRAKVGVGEPGVKSADLVQALDRAYEKLLADTLDKELLIKAAKHLELGEAKAGLELVRKGRHPAAIPLVLKDLVQREARPKFKKEDVAGHLLALAILTGEDVEMHFARMGSAHRLVADWWLPHRDRLITNIGKMAPEQLAHIARRLRDSVEPMDAYKSNGPAYYANALVYKIVYYREDSPDRQGRITWFAEELHPALGPVFLAGMGYRQGGAEGQDVVDVPFQLVPLLAAMRKNSALPQLDKVAEDATQNSGLRLVCLVALNNAGEGVRVPAVVSILAQEKKLDRKLAALEFLYYAEDLEPAADYLLEALDDPSAEVRYSAINALRRRPPPRLLKKLQELADTKHEGRLLEIIASVGTRDAQRYLADYLAKTMNDRPKTERIYGALWAFQRSVNQSWISAGSYTFDQYHGMATKAMQWWKENQGP